MISFVMSMFWLALFSFLVVQVCGILHDEFGISTKLLGFTLVATVPSFSNAVASITQINSTEGAMRRGTASPSFHYGMVLFSGQRFLVGGALRTITWMIMC